MIFFETHKEPQFGPGLVFHSSSSKRDIDRLVKQYGELLKSTIITALSLSVKVEGMGVPQVNLDLHDKPLDSNPRTMAFTAIEMLDGWLYRIINTREPNPEIYQELFGETSNKLSSVAIVDLALFSNRGRWQIITPHNPEPFGIKIYPAIDIGVQRVLEPYDTYLAIGC